MYYTSEGWKGAGMIVMCTVAGTAWLLQFIEDMQQSRAFHKTCELELTSERAAGIPEVHAHAVTAPELPQS